MKRHMATKHWKVLNSEVVFNNDWYRLRKDMVQLPSGVVINDYFISELKNVVMVFAITPERQVIFVRQYRHGVKRMLLELPAGVCGDEDVPEKVASKELFEETGYKAPELLFLGRVIGYPTKDSHHIDLFLAKTVKYCGANCSEETEDIEVVFIPINRLLNFISRGDILVSGTISCIIKALLYLKKIDLKM